MNNGRTFTACASAKYMYTTSVYLSVILPDPVHFCFLLLKGVLSFSINETYLMDDSRVEVHK